MLRNRTLGSTRRSHLFDGVCQGSFALMPSRSQSKERHRSGWTRGEATAARNACGPQSNGSDASSNENGTETKPGAILGIARSYRATPVALPPPVVTPVELPPPVVTPMVLTLPLSWFLRNIESLARPTAESAVPMI